MYTMFLREWIPRIKPLSFTTYLNVFNRKNLSIHRLKKDQCSLCVNYHQRSEEVKRKLQEKFDTHVGEKEKVRGLKNKSKKKATENASILCTTFDLQQVTYLPMSLESSIFYKRRLTNYNLTLYNISNKDCNCFLWDERQSKVGHQKYLRLCTQL